MTAADHDSSRHAHGTNQDKIWSYFQNEGVGAIDSAPPRQEFIVRQIARRLRTPRPKVLNIGAGAVSWNCGARPSSTLGAEASTVDVCKKIDEHNDRDDSAERAACCIVNI